MAHIDFFFATISPFTYLSGTRLHEIAEAHGATVSYKPLDIMALFARTGGIPPKDRHPSRQAYRLQDLRRRAKRLDMPLNLHPAHWPTNPAPSSYALIAAQKVGGDMAGLLANLTRACWAEDKNVAKDEVIAEALAAAGFDPKIASGMMVAEADEYAANLEEAVAKNVFGAPFFVVDDTEHFWGQDRLDDLDLHLSGNL